MLCRCRHACAQIARFFVLGQAPKLTDKQLQEDGVFGQLCLTRLKRWLLKGFDRIFGRFGGQAMSCKDAQSMHQALRLTSGISCLLCVGSPRRWPFVMLGTVTGDMAGVA